MAGVTLASFLYSLFFGVMTFTIITALSKTAAGSRLLSPLSAAPLTTPHGIHESEVQGDRSRFKVLSEIVADYGYWNPTPVFGGGYADPIPHEVEE